MSKKNNQAQTEVAIDKFDEYLNKNFKKILGAVGGVILIVLVIYLFYQNVEKNNASKLNQLGGYETIRDYNSLNDEEIERFLKIGETYSKNKDYIYLKTAQIYVSKGEIDKAKTLLKKVGGDLKEFADSLLYDLGENTNISYGDKSSLTLLWDYRKALSSKNAGDFNAKYKDSNLSEFLKNWGL